MKKISAHSWRYILHKFLTIVGAMNGDKPTWILAVHVGIIGHDRVLVSLAAPHFINGSVKDTKNFQSHWNAMWWISTISLILRT